MSGMQVWGLIKVTVETGNQIKGHRTALAAQVLK